MLFRRTAILNVQQVIEADNLKMYSLIQQTSLFMRIKRELKEKVLITMMNFLDGVAIE
jgi:hypothetical protein